VVPFGQSVQLIVGWKGLVYQWLTAGAVLKAVSNVVYVGDDIEVVGGDEERISHKPSLTDPNRFDPKWMNDPQNILGSYAVAWLPDKSLRLKMYRWCSRGVIEQARNSSTNATGPAWREHYAAMAAKTAIRRLDGLIQKCGTTPENREAWDRYSRTIELDNKSYNRFEDHDDDSPDDLPITSVGKVSPTSGAAVEVSAERGKIYPPPQGRKQRAVAPPPPQPPPDPEPEPEPEEPAPEVPISQEEADTLVKFAGAAGLSFSKLQEHIQEQYHVALMGLTNTQFSELMVEFRKGPAATQP
jgi:recombinational DNA repair protein RecT